jgi:putative ABC transport system permease protein
MSAFTEILDQLKRDKLRFTLMILGIAWGTFAIASMLSIGEGLRISFGQATLNVGANLLTVTPTRSSQNFQGKHANAPIFLMKKDLRAIEAIPNITNISPQYSLTQNMIYDNKMLSESVLGVLPEYAQMHAISVVPGGRFISPLDIDRALPVIVLGTNTYKDFFTDSNKDPVGKYIKLGGKPFLIIGVMQKKPQIVAREAPDEFDNWIPLSTFTAMQNPTSINSISIRYGDLNFLSKLKLELQQTIAFNRGFNPADKDIVNFQDFSEQQTTVNNFFIGMQIFLGIIGLLTLIIAGIGIANVMYASINLATREIGIRMAIGAKTRQIISSYLFQSLAISVIGGLIGLILTLLLVNGLRALELHGRLIETLGRPKPILSWFVVVIVISVLGVVGVLSGLFPAIKASRIDPAKALTYE